MHVLQVAASLNPDSAAGRLCTALRHEGCRISTLAAFPPGFSDGHYFSKATLAKLRSRIGQAVLRLYPQRQRNMPWTTPLLGNNLTHWVKELKPDIVHMHWAAASTIDFVSLRKISVPLVWTFHDVWPISGGCHCNMECTKWRVGCNKCPLLGASFPGFDLAKLLWNYKHRAYRQVNIEAICPSRWLADMTAASPLWRGKTVHHLGNAIDMRLFAPANKAEMRRLWGIPEDKPVILFGATVSTIPYKGFHLLLQALECLKKQGTDAHLVVFGENPAGNDLNFPSTSVGFVHDPARLATLYAAADVFVIPSMQDNLPTTVLESSACGTPCVAFDIGGIPDMIIHNENGYLARKFDVVDLAHGIKLILQSPELAQRWGSNAREHIFSNYESSMIARQHIELYQRVIRRG
ncbi:glycosyltransferase [uncultured Desulfovibrio sp.]|uniref:glycosyltransferase n=1 Tax=uncultured Desulfovibrio sp. TaxID=167968 RepID=UPI002610FDB0|nr:glycosyltransferase [uncultured Desulfovibrio sp.]